MRQLHACLLVVLVVAGCRNSLLRRSLIFFTNTSIGLDAGVEPSTSSGKIQIGYKRQEGVINPVYHSAGPESEPTGEYRAEAYSVIAKMTGKALANAGDTAGGSISGAQWFATGRAAKILARQPGIAAAVTGSSAVGDAATGQARVQQLMLEGKVREANLLLLENLYSFLSTGPYKKDLQTIGIVRALDRVYDPAQHSPGASGSGHVFYRFGDPAETDLEKHTDTGSGSHFQELITFLANLGESVEALKKTVDKLKAAPGSVSEGGNAISDTRATQLRSELAQQKSYRNLLDQKLSTDKAILRAVEHYIGLLVKE